MIKRLLVLLLVCNASVLYAQTDIVVVGGNATAIAAALQSSRSRLKTILLIPDSTINGELPAGDHFTLTANSNLPAGTWGEFRRLICVHYIDKPGFDTAYNAPLKFDKSVALAVFRQLTDTVKNLTIYLGASVSSLKKNGERWDVGIVRDKKTSAIKTRVVIDATADGLVLTKAGAKKVLPPEDSLAYRTSIAALGKMPAGWNNNANVPKLNYPPEPAVCIPLSAALTTADNLLFPGPMPGADQDIDYLPLQLAYGQGLGTIAAYCAFFKTTTQRLKVRAIQGELLDFKGDLLPFTDIKNTDANWRAIQQVSATGLLKGVKQADDKFLFMPDSTVNTAEIKPVLDEIYTRSFLWFNKEKPGEKFTIGNLLSFISDYTLTDPQTLQSTFQRNWKTQYKFTLVYDLRRPATRREFAVLANRYLNPFARTVDMSGRLVN